MLATALRRAPSAAARSLTLTRTPTPTIAPPPPLRRRSSAMAAAAGSSFPTAGPFFLDDFAARQWDDPSYAGTRVPLGSLTKAEFVRRVADLHAGAEGAAAAAARDAAAAAAGEGAADAAAAADAAPSSSYPLVDGYAPFCKHLFIPNVLGARVGSLPITDRTRPLLRSGYVRRRPEELPVLARWLREADVAPLPAAQFLDVILYSRAQLEAEYAASPAPEGGDGGGGAAAGGLAALRALPEGCVWGIISLKAQDEGEETPMQPITMLRNALGREEGGSGVPLDRAAYEASAAYWEGRAAVAAADAPSGE